MIGGIFTEQTRQAWCTVPGRSIAFTLNANNQYEKETYLDENGVTAFVVNYSYNANGKVILITCTKS